MIETTERLYKEVTRLVGEKTPSEMAVLFSESPQTIKNWENRGISNEGLVKAALVIDLDIYYIKTGERRPIKHAVGKNHVKNMSIVELMVNDPLQGMANKLAEVFMSVSEKNRELLQLLANKMLDQDQPTDTRSNGKKIKVKEKAQQ